MALSYNTLRAMPRLDNYAEASAHEASVVPVRTTGIKPLGNRRQQHFRIARLDDGSIVAMVHAWSRTEPALDHPATRVVYRPDGEVWVRGSPYTPDASYREVLWQVTGILAKAGQGRDWVMCAQGYLPLPVDSGQFLRFVRAAGVWECLNPPEVKVPRINRTAKTQGMRKYRQGVEQVRALHRMLNGLDISEVSETGNVTMQEVWDNLKDVFPDRREPAQRAYDKHGVRTALFVLLGGCVTDPREAPCPDAVQFAQLLASDDLGDIYKAFMWAYHMSGRLSVRDVIDTLLTKAHRDEWIETVTVTDGRIARDHYQWAFSK